MDISDLHLQRYTIISIQCPHPHDTTSHLLRSRVMPYDGMWANRLSVQAHLVTLPFTHRFLSNIPLVT